MPKNVIGEYSVSRLEILGADGAVDEALEPDLDRDRLVGMYRDMLLARRADERMLKLQRQGRIGTFGPSSGHEACMVGATCAMQDADWFIGGFRELGGRIARGEPLSNALIYHNGYEEGSVLPEDARPMLPINIIVGSQALHAVGIAYAERYRKADAVALAFFGDGATSQGDFHEALNFAAVWNVPVVFICVNNQWAISMPRSQQTKAKSLAQKAIAYEMPGIQVDGNDVLAVYAATKEAVDRARAGEGPTLIEGVTYRLLMHTTADDPRRYRTAEEEEDWQAKEPLSRFRTYLENKGYWDEAQQEALEEEVKKEVDAAVNELETRTDFKPDAPFDHVYGTRHDVIEDQRREFLAAIAKEADRG
jgi:pyruvate dehydrogenase E1 component alpha subunit